MKKLTLADYDEFISQKNAAILYDAEWDTDPGNMIRERLKKVIVIYGHCVEFAEVDIDNEPELAKSMKLLNLPSIAYYKNGKLVKLEIGATQDVEKIIKEYVQ